MPTLNTLRAKEAAKRKPHITLRGGEWYVERWPMPSLICPNFYTACMYAQAAML